MNVTLKLASLLFVAGTVTSQAGPLPLEIGDYKTANADSCYGMGYWANSLGSGIIIGDEKSPLFGDNCPIEKIDRHGDQFAISGHCSQGNLSPDRKVSSFTLKVVTSRTMIYRGKTYAWCGPGLYAR